MTLTVILHTLLSSADFFQNQLFQKKNQDYHQSVKQFGSRSGPTFCRPDLGPNSLQRLSAYETGQRVIASYFFDFHSYL